MLHDQDNLCKCCGDELILPHVDHCHISGKVRGLLCNNCNTGLGLFRDDKNRLLLAITYLENNS